MVIPDPRDPGGITRAVEVWMESGLGAQAEITLVPMSEWDATKLKQLWQAVRGYVRIAWLLASRRVDLVHVHVSSGGSLYRKAMVARLSRTFRVPVVTQLHSGGFASWLESSPRGRRAAQRLFSRSTATVVVASVWVELARKLGATEILVIPHVLPAKLDGDLSRVAEERARSERDRSKMILLYYGRWAESKGTDVLADALRLLDDSDPTAEIRVFGNGDRAWLERCFKDIEQARLHLGAWLSEGEKLRELENATVLVYPSRVEAFGQTLLETMRAGVPIITTETGAIPEVVAGYPLVRMVEPNSAPALAAAIRDVVLGRWPQSSTTKSFERTERSRIVDQLMAMYEAVRRAV